ncbi:hypothetical protein FB446DRAFT_445992 [Lentinula raphanica]|nr:hypothetical protein FB446DRAFT_445992 [Lentinula raphanica]
MRRTSLFLHLPILRLFARQARNVVFGLGSYVFLASTSTAASVNAKPLAVDVFGVSNGVSSIQTTTTTHDDTPEYGSPEFWWKMGISVFLVLLGGVFAGLTLGLMGLDELHLRVLAASSDDREEKANAKKVLKLMSKGRHWVLVVLLLGNVIVNESLPIFLDGAIGGGIAAVVISTTAIVIFGIIPQAVSVRYGLSIGAKCAPFVLGLMWLMSPLAYPIAKLLDHVLGSSETHTYKKAELKSFLQFHRTGEEPLRDDEISILNGVLELNTKRVEGIMTRIEDVVKLSADTVLDHKTLDAILSSGYSRFPIHEPGNPLAFVGLLLIKKLLQYDPSQCLPISSFPLSSSFKLYPEHPLQRRLKRSGHKAAVGWDVPRDGMVKSRCVVFRSLLCTMSMPIPPPPPPTTTTTTLLVRVVPSPARFRVEELDDVVVAVFYYIRSSLIIAQTLRHRESQKTFSHGPHLRTPLKLPLSLPRVRVKGARGTMASLRKTRSKDTI